MEKKKVSNHSEWQNVSAILLCMEIRQWLGSLKYTTAYTEVHNFTSGNELFY